MDGMDALNKWNWWRFYLLFALIFLSVHFGVMAGVGNAPQAAIDGLGVIFTGALLGRVLYVSGNKHSNGG